MPVKNVECQLAEMQIGRYVSGEHLSSEALKQLEAHVASCQSCSMVLAERRKSLHSMLAHGFAAVTTDRPADIKEHLLIKALKEKSLTDETGDPRSASGRETSPEPPSTKSKFYSLLGLNAQNPTKPSSAKSFGKPLIFSAALALVLFGMGFLTRGQGSLLGGSAEDVFPPAVSHADANRWRSATSSKDETRHSNRESRQPYTRAKSASSIKNASAKRTAFKTAAPAASHSDLRQSHTSAGDATGLRKEPAQARTASRGPEAPRRRRSRRNAHHPAPHRPATSMVHIYRPNVQVYDESGKPLGG